MDAMKNETEFLLNILCPFGCSEYCHKGSYIVWDLVLQCLLLRVLLPHVDNTRYQSVKHMWDQYYRKDNDCDTILLKKNWGIRPAIVISDTGWPQVVTYHHHAGGTKYQVLYPLYRNGRVEARCSCIVNNQRMSSTTMIFHLRLRIDGQEDMVINNYTSTWFLNNYIFRNRLPLHNRASHFSQDIEDYILLSALQVLSYINDGGGFRIIGWAKRGMIQDQEAGAYQNNQGQQRYV